MEGKPRSVEGGRLSVLLFLQLYPVLERCYLEQVKSLREQHGGRHPVLERSFLEQVKSFMGQHVEPHEVHALS